MAVVEKLGVDLEDSRQGYVSGKEAMLVYMLCQTCSQLVLVVGKAERQRTLMNRMANFLRW